MAGVVMAAYKSAMQQIVSLSPLDQISVHTFFTSFDFRDLVIAKINDLEMTNSSHHELESRVRILLEMIEESRLSRYIGLPLSLFAAILVELDYFLRIQDQEPDTRIGGYADDLFRIQELFTTYDDEIQRFLKWKAGQAAA